MNRGRKNSYDAIVVGSGPAGCKTAYELAGRGHSVLILERERLPRYKACGGGIPLKGIEGVGFDISPVIEKSVNGALITLDGADPVVLETEGIGVMVMRDRFDHFLAEKAVERGATLRDGLKVDSIVDKGETYLVKAGGDFFEGRVLVGADGANSMVARHAGLRKGREIGIAIEREVSVTEEQLAVQGDRATFDFGAVPYGYAWIFPKSGHLSIGVFTTMSKAGDLEEHLERFIEKHGVLRGCKTISNIWHPIPLGGRKEKLHRDRILLTGDAAGLADPFFGEGISFALKSGYLAADAIGALLSGKAASLDDYSRAVYRNISSDFRYARHVHTVISLNPRLSHRIFCKNRIISSYFAKVISGDMTFRDLFFRSIITFPRWIWAY